MDPRDVILRPILTEKGTEVREAENKYFFAVNRDANKIEIKGAIEAIFDVKVEKVATMNRKGKTKRVRYKQGRKPAWKKAVVTLQEGHVLDLLEGA